MTDAQRLDEIKRRQAKWDEEPFGVPPGSPGFAEQQIEGAWLAEQVPFLLAQLDAANQTIAKLQDDKSYYMQRADEWMNTAYESGVAVAQLQNTIAEKDAEIERLNEVIRTLGMSLHSAVKPRNPEHLTIKLSDHSEPKGSR